MNVNDLIWLPTLLLLGYAIPACYYDMKYREVPENFWVMLFTICIPITALLYFIGVYPLSMLGMSLGACGIYLLFRIGNVYQGADMVYLFAISLFLVQNPLTGHILMPVSFGIFLITSVLCFAIAHKMLAMIATCTKNDKLHNWLAKNYFIPYYGRFPMMLPISLALVLTVLLA